MEEVVVVQGIHAPDDTSKRVYAIAPEQVLDLLAPILQTGRGYEGSARTMPPLRV
jgi:hypothetical protein